MLERTSARQNEWALFREMRCPHSAHLLNQLQIFKTIRLCICLGKKARLGRGIILKHAFGEKSQGMVAAGCLGISKYEFQEAFLPNFCKRMAPSLALPRRCKTSVLVRPPPICPPLVFQQCRTAGNFSLRLLPSQSRFCAAAQPPTERIFTLLLC